MMAGEPGPARASEQDATYWRDRAYLMSALCGAMVAGVQRLAQETDPVDDGLAELALFHRGLHENMSRALDMVILGRQ